MFDDIIADMESNKKLSPIVTELFLRWKKLNISLAFISQSYFKELKTIRLRPTHYFIIKIPNKRELRQIAINHSFDIHFKDLIKLYKDYTKEKYSFLVKDITLLSDNPLRFRKNLSQKWLLVRQLKQSIKKSSKTKLNMIYIDKLSRFLVYHQEMLVNMNLWLA